SITLLRSVAGYRLTKLHRLVEGEVQTESYENAATFSAEITRFNSIHDLYAILRNAATDPTVCAIPGLPRPGADLQRLNRRKGYREGAPRPDIIDNPDGVAWAKLDLDSLPAPQSTGFAYRNGTPVGVVDAAAVVRDV